MFPVSTEPWSDFCWCKEHNISFKTHFKVLICRGLPTTSVCKEPSALSFFHQDNTGFGDTTLKPLMLTTQKCNCVGRSVRYLVFTPKETQCWWVLIQGIEAISRLLSSKNRLFHLLQFNVILQLSPTPRWLSSEGTTSLKQWPQGDSVSLLRSKCSSVLISGHINFPTSYILF